MSRNVFDKIGDIKNDVKRNTFDWSHDNNLTLKLGKIVPVFCEYCPPGTSLRIDPSFGLQFMPMMYPIQTKMKAYMSFYRVPLRTLWKDYKDWISSPNSNSDLTPPYIRFASGSSKYEDGNILGVSGLSDYLGLPVSTILSSAGGDGGGIFDPVGKQSHLSYNGINTSSSSSTVSTKTVFDSAIGLASTKLGNLSSSDEYAGVETGLTFVSKPFRIDSLTYKAQVPMHVQVDIEVSESFYLAFKSLYEGNEQSYPFFFAFTEHASDGDYIFDKEAVMYSSLKIRKNNSTYTITVECIHYLDMTASKNKVTGITDTTIGGVWLAAACNSTLWNSSNYTIIGSKVSSWNTSDYFGLTDYQSPYLTAGISSANRLKISAYPYRAYESVYNAYIRNNKNNPFILNGKPVYNKWITTDEGGADDTPYTLYNANWASDQFVTALPSPQQGQAPLVGITTYNKMVTNEDGTTTTQVATAIVDEDGKKYSVEFNSDGEQLKNVSYKELGADTPINTPRSLFDLATSGISINDFRNVNAYQRYLELNQFRGFSYKDIIEGRFDVNVRYDDLNMPEYLGGITRDINVAPITQTVETSDTGSYSGALGSQGGIAGVRGGTDATISCYCDEESIVIGIMNVVPMPTYTQVLPKFFLYRDRLDVFNPEFDHIGYQPIYQSELCPILGYTQNASKYQTEVFGYQRPWYEYCQKLDTAHGLFRTQLQNFLMHRTFNTIPELGSEFTTVDDTTVNDVFAVTEVSDKILGQIHFDITAKLPISRVVVPKLE